MKIAPDPHMGRHLSLTELPRLACDMGYEYIELSPRANVLQWRVQPRAYHVYLYIKKAQGTDFKFNAR